METKLLLPVTRSITLARGCQRHTQMQNFSILAVLTRPTRNVAGLSTEPILTKSLVPEKKNATKDDGWFDQLAINYLSQSLQVITGFCSNKKGYESLVEVAATLFRNFSPRQQHQLVIQALERAFPRPMLTLIRTLLPQSKFTRELFAVFTTVFFAWLVGPSEVKESELCGRREKNVVYVKKCRFLEEANCVGMCVNLCKIPCQTFIKDSLGMPVDMVPNFEDKSCEITFGQDPSVSANNPALKQPCYKSCKATKRQHSACPS